MSGQLADKVDDLGSSIDDLEEVLKPLLETPLSTLTTELSAPLDRAKLQVWLSYVLNDLVWIHLRTRGVNPSNTDSGETHDVVAELDRVKGYFAKIKEAENPAKRTMVVDGKVANRFIKHALSSAISPANFESSSSGPKPTHTRFDKQGNSTQSAGPSTLAKPAEPAEESSSDSDAEPEVGTWKAKKRAREADLAKQRAGEVDELESDDSLEGWEESKTVSMTVEEPEAQAGLSSRAKRPRMDPFTGYSQPSSKPSKPVERALEPTPSSSTQASPPVIDLTQDDDEDAARLSPSESAPSTSSAPLAGKKSRRGNRGGNRHQRLKRMLQRRKDSKDGDEVIG
ncbi:hypothetical protein FRC07_005795 [Ceratobasidium sp. 392]|nr:hypothetical protein FRC07_005795 [Ceratobasidium sp. 392]